MYQPRHSLELHIQITAALFTSGRLNSDAVVAPNILGAPVGKLLPEIVSETDKNQSPESHILKNFLPATLLPSFITLIFFARLNSECLLTISKSERLQTTHSFASTEVNAREYARGS